MRWKRLARLTEEKFPREVEEAITTDAASARGPDMVVPQITMVRSAFVADERGNLHRQVYAADNPASAAVPPAR